MYHDSSCVILLTVVATELSLVQCLGLLCTTGKRQLAKKFINFIEKRDINKYVYSRNKMTILVQCDSFGTRPKKMRISQRLFIRF